MLFAREGADVAIVYLEEDEDAEETEALVSGGASASLIAGDIGDEEFCRDAVERTVKQFGSSTCW